MGSDNPALHPPFFPTVLHPETFLLLPNQSAMFYFLIWGSAPIETPIGFAADFCFVCRKITAFSVNRVSKAPHIFFIPVGSGKTLGHTQTCQTCRATADCECSRFAQLDHPFDEDLERLAAATFPTIRQDFSERLAIEERIAADADTLEPEVRRKLLMEPFQMAARHYEHGIGARGLHLLVIALRPLHPRETEIRECLTHFRKTRARIGRRLRTAHVMERLYEDTAGRAPGGYDY